MKPERTCKQCGKGYSLCGADYATANVLIRDFCLVCIADLQDDHANKVKAFDVKNGARRVEA